MLIADVIEATVAATGYSRLMLLGQSRLRAHARPRQVGMFISFRLIMTTKAKIGRVWGGRDHTTAHHAISTVEQLLAEGDQTVVDLVAAILAKLEIDALPPTRPAVVARPLLISRIAAKERELQQLRADLAALDATLSSGAVQ